MSVDYLRVCVHVCACALSCVHMRLLKLVVRASVYTLSHQSQGPSHSYAVSCVWWDGGCCLPGLRGCCWPVGASAHVQWEWGVGREL